MQLEEGGWARVMSVTSTWEKGMKMILSEISYSKNFKLSFLVVHIFLHFAFYLSASALVLPLLGRARAYVLCTKLSSDSCSPWCLLLLLWLKKNQSLCLLAVFEVEWSKCLGVEQSQIKPTTPCIPSPSPSSPSNVKHKRRPGDIISPWLLSSCALFVDGGLLVC